jgi:hypothetical protein
MAATRVSSVSADGKTVTVLGEAGETVSVYFATVAGGSGTVAVVNGACTVHGSGCTIVVPS